MIGIYKITNLINNKCYIGQSRNIKRRFSNHKSDAFNKKSNQYNYPLYRAIRKYGIDNFLFEIIEECEIDKLSEREQFWILYYKSNNNKFGYNQTLITDYQSGFIKLNKTKLLEIIDLLTNTKILLKDIAKRYNVSLITIKDINQGHSWHNSKLDYPLRKNKIKKNFCIDCGEKITGKYRCLNCATKMLTKSLEELPINREELKQLIRTIPFVKIGQLYNVTDSAIRKWCKKFNLPYKSSEIKKYSDEEWNTI